MSEKNVMLTLIDGIGNGRIEAVLDLSVGKIYKIPRSDLEKCKDIEHLINNRGVYILVGLNEKTAEKYIYIGKADVKNTGGSILSRLNQHKLDTTKMYWKNAVVITTSDNSLNATDISYLENRFYTIAREANASGVANSNEPNNGGPNNIRKKALEKFITEAKMVIGALGIDVLEKTDAKIQQDLFSQTEEFFYFGKERTAKGKRAHDGFMVIAGSSINLKTPAGLHPGYKSLCIQHSKSVSKNGKLREDILFSSPSAAGTFVAGCYTNGRIAWKTDEGKTLKQIEEEESQKIT